MKKIGIVTAALVLTAALSGCGSLPVAPARTTPTAATPAAQSTADPAHEAAYLTALRTQLPRTDFSRPGLWVDLGHAVCNAFDSGLTPKEVFDSLKGGAVSEPEASAVVVISGIHLCPEYAPSPQPPR